MRAEWVPYGRAAAEALRAEISTAKGFEPLAPVSVVVPSNHVGVATRRMLASGKLGPVCGRGVGLAAVDFLTTYRLAELVGSPILAEAGRRPVSTPVIAAAVRAALAEDAGRFAPVAAHPATEAALVASYREIREVSAEGLERLSRSGTSASEVVRLHGLIRARLLDHWYDEQDLMAAASGALAAGTSAALGGAATVIVYLPQRLSPHGAALLRAAASEADVVVLAGATGIERADAEVRLSLSRLGASPAGSFDAQPLSEIVAAERTKVLTASDSDDEVRAAVRAVVDAARAGTPLDRIAILHAGPGPYGRLMHEHLAAAGLASNGPSVLPLAARLAGRFLLGLFSLAEGGYRRAEVLAWISDTRLRVDGRTAPVDHWEAISRAAGVVAGRTDWDQRVDRFEAGLTARSEKLTSEGSDAKSDRARNRARSAQRLRAFVLGVIDSIDLAASRPHAWDDHAAWARGLMHDMLGNPNQWTEWPAAERKGAERVDAALDRLGALSAVEGPVTLEIFHRTLELELESDLGRVGRFGEGVLVGPVSMGIGLDLDLVIVVGLAEGTFPATVHDDSLLPDRAREVAGDELALSSSRVDRQHREFLAALAGAPAQLLAFPRGDLRRSIERVPSRWLLDVASAIAGEKLWSPALAVTDAPWVSHVGSFDAGLRRLTFPSTQQEHRLRALLADDAPGRRLTDAEDPVLATGAQMVGARRSTSFTRFDGNLAGVAVPSPVERTASPTGLERWARCPHAYFQERVLGVSEPDQPEDALRITPMARGSLVHRALERFIEEALERTGGRGPEPTEPWSATDRQRMVEIAADLFEEYEADGLTGRMIFWRRDSADITKDLMSFLLADSLQRSTTDSRPLAAELSFGRDPDDSPGVEIALTDGRSVSFHGSADRVDVADDGRLFVVDYKTGGAREYSGLSEEDPTRAGRRLQLPIYGLAARQMAGTPDAPVRAEYWFVSAKGEFKRSGYMVTDEVMASVSSTLTALVTGIEAGQFPPHPTDQSTKPWVDCAWCDPDGLGVGDLRRQWDAKRSDPAMATYADSVEPLDEDDPEHGDD